MDRWTMWVLGSLALARPTDVKGPRWTLRLLLVWWTLVVVGAYLAQTKTHVEVVTRTMETLGLDPAKMTPGRQVVGHIGKALVMAMEMALKAGDKAAAELVACECVVLAETKDHSNWELIGHVAEHGKGEEAKVLKTAYEAVEKDEDHHLYHTKGWCRELWIQSLGFAAVLPPPEEVKQVETAIGAARAENARDEMRKH